MSITREVAPHAGARIETAKKRDRPQRLMVHSALVSESKPGRSFGPLQSGQSYPARVRESKPLRRLRKVVIYPSHPSRVRESKCGKCDYLGNPNVAPHAGARIEITIKRPLWQKSHPNMGVGIEIPESRL